MWPGDRSCPAPAVATVGRQPLAGRRTSASAAAAGQASSSAWIRSCIGSPGTLRWISALGSRSASGAGLVEGGELRGQGQRARAGGVEQHPAAEPPQLVTGPLDQHAARAQPRGDRTPGAGHLALVVLAQHVERADQAGRSPASSKPPRAKVNPGGSAAGWAAATRTGSISSPATRTSARTAAASRARNSTAVTGVAP